MLRSKEVFPCAILGKHVIGSAALLLALYAPMRTRLKIGTNIIDYVAVLHYKFVISNYKKQYKSKEIMATNNKNEKVPLKTRRPSGGGVEL
jgi:hypothetical protein